MIGRLTVAGTPRVLNWQPSLPTRVAHFQHDSRIPFPAAFSLMGKMPPIRDQGQLGACTAFSAEAPLWVAQLNAGRPNPRNPSPLFLYYCERALNGQIGSDSGAAISDIYRASHKFGVCPEELWPYDVNKFADEPPDAAYASAAQETAHIYAPVLQTEAGIKGCLNHGFPVNFGFTVYESFESPSVAKSGIVPMPGATETVLGGHAVDIVGYNDGPGTNLGIPPQYFLVRNSWGTGWGMAAYPGYFAMPYEYVLSTDLADDPWMIRLL
jgi:C1A family cysteine protease